MFDKNRVGYEKKFAEGWDKLQEWIKQDLEKKETEK